MITEQKEQFPKLEDIEWVMVEAPEWLAKPRIVNGYVCGQKYMKPSFGNGHFFKEYHENSKDFKVTWQLKQIYPHAEIKAQYEEALKKYDVVYFEWSHKNEGCWHSSKHYPEVTIYQGMTDCEIRLKYYNIDWNKLLSWSYANGEFVKCMFSNYDFSIHSTILLNELTSFRIKRNVNVFNRQWEFCRLEKGVEIKDEWLKEVK